VDVTVVDNIVRFRLSGRFAHFARAETQTTILSYPVPPRTAILGLIGAVLGLAKDEAPVVLDPCDIAVAGLAARSHWHTAKLRKDPPEALPRQVKSSQTIDKATKPEKASLIIQEWLWHPDYTVWARLPAPYHTEFVGRLRQGRWHFSPCLGLSEMLASISEVHEASVAGLPPAVYPVRSVLLLSSATVDVAYALERSMGLHIVSMPRTVTPNRVFSHQAYVMETQGMAIVAETAAAYQVDDEVIMFL
jgi:CRISPR-associated protein Cas5h